MAGIKIVDTSHGAVAYIDTSSIVSLTVDANRVKIHLVTGEKHLVYAGIDELADIIWGGTRGRPPDVRPPDRRKEPPWHIVERAGGRGA